MDYETKIYLDKLIEAVESPDGWSIGATIFAAIAAAIITWVLGWRQSRLQEQQLKIQEHQNELQEQQLKIQEHQNELQEQQIKLQEQQNKQQEYEVYRALYVIIKDINRQAENLPTRIYEYFTIPTYNDIFPNGFWKFMYKEVNTLSRDLDDRLADFELKFGDNDVDADDYYLLVCKMRMLLQFAERMEANKHMICIEQQGRHPACEVVRGNYSPLLDALAERTIYEPYKDAVRGEFERFINYRQHVLNKKILDKIKERC